MHVSAKKYNPEVQKSRDNLIILFIIKRKKGVSMPGESPVFRYT